MSATDPGRTAYEARFADVRPREFEPWDSLPLEVKAIWARVEFAVRTAPRVAAPKTFMVEMRRIPPSPIPVRGRFYLTECPDCGWVGSSEQCGSDLGADDSDVYCPACDAPGCEGAPSDEEVARHGEAVMQRILDAEAMRARLLIAFHDAIRRPLGVTPDSGAEFYDPRMAEEAEERRRLKQAGGRHAYRPHKLYPHFCAQCGYSEREALMHLPATDAGLKERGGNR